MKQFYRYLPLSKEAQNRGLYIIAGGYAFIPSHTPYPPLQHPDDHHFRWDKGRTLQEFQILYITRGGGLFESRHGGLYTVKTGMMFVLFPNEWHRYSPHEATGWDEYWIAFQGKFASHIIEETLFSLEKPVLEVGSEEKLLKEYLQVTEELRHEVVGHQNIMTAHLQMILGLSTAIPLRRNFADTEQSLIIDRAKCLLLERSNQAVNIENLAAELNVGYSWFRRSFSEYTGLSPAQYHLQLRLSRAREQLRVTTLPVTTISQQLGFQSPEYFARIFKEKLGYSPREFRAHAQESLAIAKTQEAKGIEDDN